MLEFIVANNILAEVVLALGTMFLSLVGSGKDQQKKMFLFLAAILLVIVVFVAREYYDMSHVVSLFGFFASNPYIVFSKFIIVVFAVLSIFLAMGYTQKNKLFRPSEFSILLLLSVLGMFVLLSANDLFSMYCGLELQAICLYVLTSCDRDNIISSEAGMKYLIVGIIASIILLYGISLVFGFTGTTNFSVLVEQLYPKYAAGTAVPVGVLIGAVLIIISICIKVAVAPFHFWAPDVYQGAPLPVTAFLSTVPKVALVLFVVRLIYTVLYPWYSSIELILKAMIVMSLLVGTLGALKQHNIKRLLAYSAISHIGFIFLGLISGSTLGINAVVIYLCVYSVMTVGMFAFVAVLQKRKGQENFDLSIFQGLAKDHPVMAFSISVLLLSMAGFPPLAGFLVKFYIIIAAMNSGIYFVVVVALVTSVISTYYYLRIIKFMYFDNKVDDVEYVLSTENVVVATFATVFNLILILSPTGLNSVVSFVTSNLLK